MSEKIDLDKKLFEKLDKLTKKKFKKFSKYYVNDSKLFINKILRDNLISGKFPIHIYKTIKNIDKKKYDSAICLLRGALPYSIIFEALGWKVHYVICGRKNEKIVGHRLELRFNRSVDRSMKSIKGKKYLIVENNVVTGNTPIRATEELKKYFSIRKPDLFLDYIIPINDWMKGADFFDGNKSKMGFFGKIYTATISKKNRCKNPFSPRIKISPRESLKLKDELLCKLKAL